MAFASATAIVLSISSVARHSVADGLRWTDRNITHEFFKEARGRLFEHEDWENARPLTGPETGDPAWLRTTDRPLFIGHALGASDNPDKANTIAALLQSADQGLRILEVDLWLDANGQLRCYHGDDENTPPPENGPIDCTFGLILPYLARKKLWVVLDIKSDFEKTGEAIVNALRNNPTSARSVIFQLYAPNQLAMFAHWTYTLPLAAPIVTVYRSKRSVQTVADSLTHIGIQALALPIERKNALRSRPAGLSVFVHPIYTIEQMQDAIAWKADGMYITSSVIQQIGGKMGSEAPKNR